MAAAKAAFPAWSGLSPTERGKYMKKLAALLRENHKEMAWLEAMSMGRPVGQYFDAFAAAEAYDYFAEAGYDCQGTSSLNTPGFLNMTFRQPYGVVGWADLRVWGCADVARLLQSFPGMCLLSSSRRSLHQR